MRIRTVKLVQIVSALVLLGVVGCSSKYPQLNTYYYGVEQQSINGQNITPLYWKVAQNGSSVTISTACGGQQLYQGEFASDGSSISLAPTGQSVISAVAKVNGTAMVLVNPSNPSQITQAMSAVQTVDCGSTTGANAILGRVPPQFMVAAPDAPGIGSGNENAALLDCSPDYVNAHGGASGVSSGCLHTSEAFPIKTLPVSSNYVDGSSVKSKSTSCDLSGIVCVSSDISAGQMKQLASVAALTTTGQIWAGNLLQGGTLASGGGIAPITISRAPAEFVIKNLKFAPGATYGFSLPNPGWTAADYETALNAKLDSTGIVGQTANLTFTNTQVYSSNQLDFALSVDGTIDDVQLGAKLGLNTDKQQNHILFVLRQVFYTVQFIDPPTMVSVFEDGVNFTDPDDLIGASNPPLYISTVDYGRQVYFLVSSALDSSLITASVTAAFNGQPDEETGKADSFHLESDLKYSDVLKQSSISYAVIGGGIEGAIAVLGGDTKTVEVGDTSVAAGTIPTQSIDASGLYNNVRNFFGSVHDAKYSASNPAAPVAFTANMLKTKATAVKAYTADYEQQQCVKYAATPARFQMRLAQFNNQICLYPNGRPWSDGTNCYTGSDSEVKVDLSALWGAEQTSDQTLELVQWINFSNQVPTGKVSIYNSNLGPAQFASILSYNGTAYGGAGHDLDVQWILNQNRCDLDLGVIGTVSLSKVDAQAGAFRQCPTVADGSCP